MRLRIYFGGASPNCGAGVRPYLIRRPALAHKNPTRFSRGSMSISDIRLVCAKAIRKAVADEHFEDAAAVRNARDKLERSITKTINNICPF